MVPSFSHIANALAWHAQANTEGYRGEQVAAYEDAMAYVDAYWSRNRRRPLKWWTALWDAHERGEAIEVGCPFGIAARY